MVGWSTEVGYDFVLQHLRGHDMNEMGMEVESRTNT